MSGGKRFADDFDRIDAVKPNDRILIQDSDDGNVKFANPSQFPKVEGGGGSSSPQIMMRYAVRDGSDKDTPAFVVSGLTEDLDQYRVFFYRHIKSRRRKRDEKGRSGRYTRYGWIHPADGASVVDDYTFDGRNNVMINEDLVDEHVIMTEFGLRPTDTPGTYTLVHPGRDGVSNKRNPDAPVSATDIISPYVWVKPDRDHYDVRVSFGRTHRGGAVLYPGGQSYYRLRNMGFVLVRITDRGPEIVTDILPFTVRFQISIDRNGFAYIAHE